MTPTKEQKEVWKDVVGYEGKYKVSNLGRVTGLGGILKTNNNSQGYHRVLLSNKGERKNVTVHKLVMETFVGKRPYKHYHIEHIDHDKTNNKLSNIRYCSPEENRNRSINDRRHRRGEAHQNAKANMDIVNAIRSSDLLQKELAQKYKISESTVGRIRRFELWV